MTEDSVMMPAWYALLPLLDMWAAFLAVPKLAPWLMPRLVFWWDV